MEQKCSSSDDSYEQIKKLLPQLHRVLHSTTNQEIAWQLSKHISNFEMVMNCRNSLEKDKYSFSEFMLTNSIIDAMVALSLAEATLSNN